MSIVSMSAVDLGQVGVPIHSGAEVVDSGAGVDGGVTGPVVAGAPGALTGVRGRLNGPPIVTPPTKVGLAMVA